MTNTWLCVGVKVSKQTNERELYMASESNCQPSNSPIMNSSDYRTTSRQIKPLKLFQRFFGKLQAKPFIYTDELKQYSVNGPRINKNLRTVK